MATQKKTGGSRTAASSGGRAASGGRRTAPSSKGRGSQPQSQPYRREIGGVVCFLLALVLAAGMVVFLFRYLTQGGDWASSAFNRHLYNAQGQLTAGTVLDRDGDVLSSVEDGVRTYYDS